MIEENQPLSLPLTERAEARLPTRFGDFRMLAFRLREGGPELGLVARGELQGAEGVPVRLHSACFTGDLMGSLRCDCREQLEAALAFLGRQERGALIYLPQEGRGIGLVNKVRAYALQQRGLDTVEANRALGFEDDLRRYDQAAELLARVGVVSVRLISNNPLKREGLEANGIRVDDLIPLRVAANPHNARYLKTKRSRCGHLL